MSDSLQPVGLFPLCFRIGSSLDGAPTLQLNLLICAPDRTVNGSATVTQATNPPLDLVSDVWGDYTYMALMSPAPSKILITVQGNHGGPSSNSITNFKLHLVVSNDWKEGVANYQYLSGQQWISIDGVPAQWVELESTCALPPLEPGPVMPLYPPILPMYAAPIQTAIASGDLAQMKNLAKLAQQQLDQEQPLRSALEAAKGEINTLQGR